MGFRESVAYRDEDLRRAQKRELSSQRQLPCQRAAIEQLQELRLGFCRIYPVSGTYLQDLAGPDMAELRQQR